MPKSKYDRIYPAAFIIFLIIYFLPLFFAGFEPYCPMAIGVLVGLTLLSTHLLRNKSSTAMKVYDFISTYGRPPSPHNCVIFGAFALCFSLFMPVFKKDELAAIVFLVLCIAVGLIWLIYWAWTYDGD